MKVLFALILAIASSAFAQSHDAIPGHAEMVVYAAKERVRAKFRNEPEKFQIEAIRTNPDASVVCVHVAAPRKVVYVFVRGRERLDDYASLSCEGYGIYVK